ncbi:MAG: hypothetical protein RIE53_08820 [Rhodothermales bacterium]
MSENENTFTKEEVAALLERTAELQLQQSRQHDGRPGLTLSELEQIAEEAGLDPQLLRTAAREMATIGSATGVRGLASVKVGESTNSTHNYIDRVVPGACTDDALENMVAHLRHRFDTDLGSAMGSTYGASSVDRIGRNIEWKHTSLSGIETRVLVRVREEAMHVRFSQRVGLASPIVESMLYGGILSFFAALVSAAALDSGGLGVLSFLAALALFAPLVFLLDTRWRASKHRQLAELADEVSVLLSDSAPLVQLPSAQAERMAHPAHEGGPAVRLDPLIDDQTDGSGSTVSRSRTH